MPDSKTPEDMSWPDLLRACGENLRDRALWDQFSKTFEKPLFTFLLRAVRKQDRQEDTRALVRDLTQEVYIRLFENNGQLLRSFKGETPFSALAFLSRISMHVSGDRYRRGQAQRRQAEIISIDEARERASNAAAQLDLDARLRWADMERLIRADSETSNHARNVLICKLHFLDGLSAEDIAQYPGFGLTPNGVEAVIRRIREHLQRKAGEL